MTCPVVLITGALTGIGRATALAFAQGGEGTKSRRAKSCRAANDSPRGIGLVVLWRVHDFVRHDLVLRGVVLHHPAW